MKGSKYFLRTILLIFSITCFTKLSGMQRKVEICISKLDKLEEGLCVLDRKKREIDRVLLRREQFNLSEGKISTEALIMVRSNIVCAIENKVDLIEKQKEELKRLEVEVAGKPQINYLTVSV